MLSGITTGITSKIHQKIIQKFDECWVPDIESEYNYSGKLGHLKEHTFKVKYIGVLSRFKYKKLNVKYDLLVLLSGLEPQRTLLENKLLKELKSYKKNVLFVRGVLNNEVKIKASNHIKIVDYLGSTELETAINESEIVLARSGYSTIMDLAVLGKKAFFIPTPGQFEQEYLAKTLREKLIAPFATQDNFKVDNLKELAIFSGFNTQKMSIDLNIFNLFERK
ncbi:glycosyltransferase [Lutibacter sp.]